MEEIIIEIKKAEEEAEQIIALARHKAREEADKADAEITALRLDAKRQSAFERAEILKKAEEAAADEYRTLVESGTREAAARTEASVKNADKAAAKIVGRIKNGDR